MIESRELPRHKDWHEAERLMRRDRDRQQRPTLPRVRWMEGPDPCSDLDDHGTPTLAACSV